MVDKSPDRNAKKVLFDARQMIEDIDKVSANEAETARRVERVFESIMGYDALKHVTREYAVHGAGDTEYCDFAIRLNNEETSKPIILVEVKSVSVDLVSRHIKQSASYAINLGCEWVILTNGKEWRLYHISFNQPPETTLLESWDLLTGDPAKLLEQFSIIGLKSVRQNGLNQLWQKRNVLSAGNMLGAILSPDSLALLRRRLRSRDVGVSPEEIIGAIRRLLNESAITELEQIKICLPKKKVVKKAVPVLAGAPKLDEPACAPDKIEADELK